MGRSIVNIIIKEWVGKDGLYVLLTKSYRLDNESVTYETSIEDFMRSVKNMEEKGDFIELKKNPIFRVLTEDEYRKMINEESYD